MLPLLFTALLTAQHAIAEEKTRKSASEIKEKILEYYGMLGEIDHSITCINPMNDIDSSQRSSKERYREFVKGLINTCKDEKHGIKVFKTKKGTYVLVDEEGWRHDEFSKKEVERFGNKIDVPSYEKTWPQEKRPENKEYNRLPDRSKYRDRCENPRGTIKSGHAWRQTGAHG
ncbi:MAG: hypothetical protein ACOY3I_00805 [Verrucomicrobiota bacterium]